MNSPIVSIDWEKLQPHIEQFAKAFLKPRRAERWLSVLMKLPGKGWKKIAPWDVWDERHAYVDRCRESDAPIAALISTPSFAILNVSAP